MADFTEVSTSVLFFFSSEGTLKIQHKPHGAKVRFSVIPKESYNKSFRNLLLIQFSLHNRTKILVDTNISRKEMEYLEIFRM